MQAVTAVLDSTFYRPFCTVSYCPDTINIFTEVTSEVLQFQLRLRRPDTPDATGHYSSSCSNSLWLSCGEVWVKWNYVERLFLCPGKRTAMLNHVETVAALPELAYRGTTQIFSSYVSVVLFDIVYGGQLGT